MKTVLRLVLVSISFLGLASALIHPFGGIRSQRSTGPLLAGAETNPAIAGIIERACQNCHSERTEWPWYSYVAPLSWMIENDVHRGRGHMNLSRWDAYTVDQQVEILTRLGVEVRNRRMPLPKYLQLHPEARLSDADIEQLYAWAHSERQRLRSAIME
jgi:hypothetical protein